MNCGISKVSTGRSRMKPSNIAQQKLLAAVANTGAGKRAGNVPPGEWDSMLTHQMQSFRRATESSYDGAALVYARNQALSYLVKPDPDGHAEVTTFTTDGTNLNMYAHHAAPLEDGTLEYHQYPIKSANLINSYEGFKEGRRWVRNAQDHAKEQSYTLRDQLKEHWKQCRGGLHPIGEGAPLPGAEGISRRRTETKTKLAMRWSRYPASPRPRHFLDRAGRQTPSIR